MSLLLLLSSQAPSLSSSSFTNTTTRTTTCCSTMILKQPFFLWMLSCCCYFSMSTMAFVVTSPPISHIQPSTTTTTTWIDNRRVGLVTGGLYYQTSSSTETSVASQAATDHRLQQQQQQQHHRDALKQKLPPVERGRSMTKLELEFRELLEGILYTPIEIESITDFRLRAIYEGISASYYEPAVYRAFEVLYADLPPLRIAGRRIYKTLRSMMEDSLCHQQEQMERIITATGLPMEQLIPSWKTFHELAQDQKLSMDRLSMSMGDVYTERLGFESMEDFINAIDPNRKGELTFDETVIALYQYTTSSTTAAAVHVPSSSSGLLLLFLDLTNFRPLDDAQSLTSDGIDGQQQRAKYNARYDDMIEKFTAWKELIPSGQGRRLDILHGCFVGSENPKVVDALRVVYVDYPALRMCGNWIFNVVSTLIKASQKSKQRSIRQQQQQDQKQQQQRRP